MTSPIDRGKSKHFNNLSIFIEQHVENFFSRTSPSNQETKEFDDSHTRHPNIRRYLAQTIISRIVEPEGNRYIINISEIRIIILTNL